VKYGGITAEAMVASAWRHIRILEKEGFDQIKISLKSSDLVTTIAAYRLMAEQCDYPLHIGLTEAGTFWRGGLRSAAAIGALLAEGIGDTVRVSVSGDPVQEVRIAQELLSALNLREGGWHFIACPTCGRAGIDVAGIMAEVEEALAYIDPLRRIKIAVMGCAVNGPGEAREADIGVAGGNGKGVLFEHGEVVCDYAVAELATVLIAKAKELAK
jgi:(E)-4-hydroxy-3-methylbut-2-enyl-diphosphate synthase